MAVTVSSARDVDRRTDRLLQLRSPLSSSLQLPRLHHSPWLLRKAGARLAVSASPPGPVTYYCGPCAICYFASDDWAINEARNAPSSTSSTVAAAEQE
jgi:hypothetical protein